MADSKIPKTRFVNPATKFRTYKKPQYGPKVSTSTTKSTGFNLKDIEEMSAQYGIKPPKQKGPGVLSRLSGFLNVSETGDLAYRVLTGGNVGESLKMAGKGLAFQGTEGKMGYADVLKDVVGVKGDDIVSKAVRGIGGTALDIGLDPMTYLTLGVSAKGKLAKDATAKAGAGLAAKKTEKTIQFAGQTIGDTSSVWGKALQAYKEPLNVGGEVIHKIGDKIEPVGSFLKGVEDALGQTFVRNYDLKKLGFEDLGDKIDKLGMDKRILREQSVVDSVRLFANENGGKLPTAEEFKQFFDVAGEGFGKTFDADVLAAVNGKGITDRLSEEINKLPERIREPYRKYITEYRSEFKRLAKSLGIPDEVVSKPNYITWVQQELDKKGVVGAGGFGKVPSVLKKRTKEEFLGETKNPLYATAKTLSELRVAEANRSGILGMIKDLGDDAILLSKQQAKQAKKILRGGVESSGEIVEIFNNGKIETWRVPAEVGKAIKTFTTPKDTNKLIQLYDKATRLWAGSVTKYFPAFHFRNETNNLAMMMTAGWEDPVLLKDALNVMGEKAGQLVTKNGGKIDYADLIVEMKKRNVWDTGWFGTNNIDDLLKNHDLSKLDLEAFANGKLVKKNADGLIKRIDKFVGEVGSGIENHAKITLFMDQVKKGHSFDEAAKTVKQFLFDYGDLTDIERNVFKRVIPFYCVPEDSQALTRVGWKHYSEIKLGEDILTYSTEKDQYEWQPVKEIATFEHNQELMVLEGKRHKLRFTPEHRWVVKRRAQKVRRPYGEYEYPERQRIVTGAELTTMDNIKVTSRYHGRDSILSVEEARLLGWLLTDGYFRQRGNHVEAMIYQHPNKFLDEVKEVAGGNPRNPHPDSGTVCVPVLKERVEAIKEYLMRSKVKDDWCDVVGALSEEAMEAMYDAMYKADGGVAESRTSNFFANNRRSGNKGVGRTFEMLATLLGKRVIRNKRGYQLSEKGLLKVGAMEKKMEHYDGVVWCPRTENGTWVMKQNRLITITGNTFMRKNVTAQLQILGGGMGNRQVYANLFKGIENAKEIYGGKLTPEEKALLPEWVQESMYIPLGKDKDGNMKYMTSLGLGLEELANLTPSDLMSRVNPILKVPIEQISGHSFFTKGPIEESSYYTRTYPGVSQLPGIRDYLGTKESERDVYKGGQKTGEKQRVITVNPKRKHLLDAFIGRTYTTVGKIGDDRKTFTERMTNALTGARVSTIDFGEQGYWQDRELMEQLQQQLIDMGYLKEYKSVYKPKN